MKKIYLLVMMCFASFSGLIAQDQLNGYNIAHVFHPFPNHKINAEAMALFDQLAPDILRFPGGTIANKYHYSKPGYGFSSADLKRSENYIVDFVKLVKGLKTQPKVIYVYNMFDHFKGANEAELIKENFDALQYLINNGVNVVAVELGNEFYLYNEIIGTPGQTTFNPEDNNKEEIETGGNQQKPNTTAPKNENILIRWLRMLTGYKGGSNNITSSNESGVTDNDRLTKYARLAKIYHDKTKKIDPKIKTGIPLGNFKNNKHTEYNEFILSPAFNFVNAYVVHFYGAFDKDCKEGDLNCVRAGLDWTIKATIEPRLQFLKEKTNKEIWVTEWNAIKFGHYGDESSWARNTSVHVEYTKKMIDLFKQYGVTISTFHKLVGPTEDAAYNAIDVTSSGKCITTPIFDILKKHF
jgi:hypothetical protein